MHACVPACLDACVPACMPACWQAGRSACLRMHGCTIAVMRAYS